MKRTYRRLAVVVALLGWGCASAAAIVAVYHAASGPMRIPAILGIIAGAAALLAFALGLGGIE